MSRTSRRPLLTVLAVAGALLALAGCKSDTAGRAAGGHAAAVTRSASASPSASASASGAMSASPSASAPAARASAAPPSSIPAPHLGEPVTKVSVGSDRRTLTLTYWRYVESCGSAWHAHDKVTDGHILVWMTYDTTHRKPGQVTCAHITWCHTSCDRTASLTLSAPVDARPIYDGYTGKRLA